MARPRTRAVLSRNTPSFALEPAPPLPHHRTRLQRNAPVAVFGTRSFTQHHNLPHHPLSRNSSPPPASSRDDAPLFEDNVQVIDTDTSTLFYSVPEGEGGNDVSRTRRRRAAQWKRWQEEFIPAAIQPFMHLMKTTQSLRLSPIQPDRYDCKCEQGRTLRVKIVRFAAVEEITLRRCDRHPVGLQLLQRGLFPCVPVMPSLAVDMKVLEFARTLFLRVSPNVTAVSHTLEDCLSVLGYKLDTIDSLRRRFGNALNWYNGLKDATDHFVGLVLEASRSVCVERASIPTNNDSAAVEDSLGGRTGKQTHSRSSSSSSHADSVADEPQRKRQRRDKENEPQNPFPEPPLRDRPSDYLRARCPLCFGGKIESTTFESGPHSMASIDACFQQKHNKQVRDPVFNHPHSYFLDEDLVERMESYVESIRPSCPRTSTTKQGGGPHDDKFEHEDLKVPRSVLDACNASFTAAEESREKASTQFFDVTGLMALICRHDRVLWIVNMKSAGEKQAYALALVETFFQHVPHWWKLGLLYDIICQLHRSCLKWGFLKHYIGRLFFGLSVFHAFGHGWPCQLIYHPRKCRWFGLTDGEGCERVWKMLRFLIAFLRICGYHLRLRTLNSELHHLMDENLERAGKWISRKLEQCRVRSLDAQERLDNIPRGLGFLREQWHCQVETQTLPLPRQSKNKGKLAIEEAKRLRLARNTIRARVHQLQRIISDTSSLDHEIVIAQSDLQKEEAHLLKADERVKAKERAFGTTERSQLDRLLKNKYAEMVMNARALKIRIRQRLISRKFERDRVERSFREHINHSEKKLQMHTEASIKRRDPSIQSLAHKYNKLVDEIIRAIDKDKKRVLPPLHINLNNLFGLDVDDDIWQDVGLTESDEVTEPPAWLCNEEVRDGIKAMLEQDRCEEERQRLIMEKRSLQEWFQEEWLIVNEAIGAADDPGLCYQLQLRRQYLLRLCANWQSSLGSTDAELWGPTAAELLDARVAAVQASVTRVDNEVDDLDDDDLEVEEEYWSDDGLVEALETLQLADGFRDQDHTHDEF